MGTTQLRSWTIVLVLVVFWPIVYLAHADRQDPGPLDRLVLMVTAPVFNAFSGINATVADAWAERQNLATARQDYFDLWQEHRRLRLENMTLRARLDAVERLESLVGPRMGYFVSKAFEKDMRRILADNTALEEEVEHVLKLVTGRAGAPDSSERRPAARGLRWRSVA